MGDRPGIATRREQSPSCGGSPDTGVSSFPTRLLGRFGPRLSSCWRNDCLPAETPRERFPRPSPLALRLDQGRCFQPLTRQIGCQFGEQFTDWNGSCQYNRYELWKK